MTIDKVFEGQNNLIPGLGGLEIFRTSAIAFFDALSK
jgi:hypothetical protein